MKKRKLKLQQLDFDGIEITVQNREEARELITGIVTLFMGKDDEIVSRVSSDVLFNIWWYGKLETFYFVSVYCRGDDYIFSFPKEYVDRIVKGMLCGKKLSVVFKDINDNIKNGSILSPILHYTFKDCSDADKGRTKNDK
jgi:hypothetical protein